MTKILVTGATGTVGRHVVAGLARAEADVRALVRDPAAVALPAGVEAARGDLTDLDSLAAAVRGVERVYLMWPGLPVDPRVVEVVTEHARQVVYLSTDVTDLADNEEPTSYHQAIERQLRRSGVTWTFLRAIDFAANTLRWADQIRQGTVRYPYGQAARSLIHERDIADVAVRALTARGAARERHEGVAHLLTGPEALTQVEQVRIIGEVIGRAVRWEELPAEVAREEFTAAWGDAEFVAGRLRAWKSFVDTPERVTDTVERLLGRPARTFREWATDHADAFR
ncbi:NmrA family NAD(P)-binding protein [Streptomyces sp. NPDC057702]|uniref:NmrA family NAD(P)-binding protein n=1 Tax=unclassified Streptomyces TaxID=2593676 RepID=UPI00368C81DC